MTPTVIGIFTVVILAYAVWVVVVAVQDWRGGSESHAAGLAGRGPTALPDAGYISPEEELAALSPEALQLALDMHYRQVLANPQARKVWRKLLADAAAVERYAKVGH